MQPTKYRAVSRIVPTVHTTEGAGFGIYRPFPTQSLDMLDPFLLLDEMEPVDHAPGEAQGAPDHPHRGFETVTYILEGEFEHRDSRGNEGTIAAGGVQWMTAGDGIVHSEMPSRRIQTEGGRVHGFQIWINLPRSHKRATPRYQYLEASDLAVLEGDGWSTRVIAGTMMGIEGPATTHTPIGIAHIKVDPGALIDIPVPVEHVAAIYTFSGRATVGESHSPIPARTLAVFEPGEGSVLAGAPDGAGSVLEALVLTGLPLGEPVARQGPFVMNTRDELIEAFNDYRDGKMGSIAPSGRP